MGPLAYRSANRFAAEGAVRRYLHLGARLRICPHADGDLVRPGTPLLGGLGQTAGCGGLRPGRPAPRPLVLDRLPLVQAPGLTGSEMGDLVLLVYVLTARSCESAALALAGVPPITARSQRGRAARVARPAGPRRPPPPRILLAG